MTTGKRDWNTIIERVASANGGRVMASFPSMMPDDRYRLDVTYHVEGRPYTLRFDTDDFQGVSDQVVIEHPAAELKCRMLDSPLGEYSWKPLII